MFLTLSNITKDRVVVHHDGDMIITWNFSMSLEKWEEQFILGVRTGIYERTDHCSPPNRTNLTLEEAKECAKIWARNE